MRILILLIICSLSKALHSQDQDSLIIKNQEISLKKNLNEVVVTGQISALKAEDAIHKIRVISKKTLTSGLFNDLSSLLEKELNIRISQDNLLGSSISLQGISGQNVKILINDIPVIGRLNGNIDLSQISLNNVDRIEIVEGPLSTIYGTDALGGTINIITTTTPIYNHVANTYYESVGKYNYDFMLANQNEKILATYSFGRKYFNGWSENQNFNLLPTNEIADTNRFKQWNPKKQLTHKITYNIIDKNYKINNYLETFYEKITNLGKPRQPYLENAFDEYYYTQRTNIGSDINIQNNNDKIRILLAYNKFTRFKETFYTDLTDLSKILVQDESAQDTSIFDLLMAKIMISRNDNAKLNYQIGIDVEQQSANGKRILDNYQEQSDYAFFSTVEYKLNNIVSIRPSSRIIYNTKYKAPIIPALNILYDFNKYKLRISYAKGFRAPELKELFLYFVDINHNIVGNPLLFAEESNNYSLNATINKEIFKTSTTTDINVFYNDISNKIELTNSAILAEQYSYFNIDNYLTKGISASTKLSIKKTELNFGISYTGRYNNLNTTFNTPKFNYTMDYSISTFFSLGAKTKVNIFFKNIGKSPVFIAEDNIVIESYSEQYSLLDISINRRIYNDALIFSIGAKNLFDVTNIRRNRNNSEMHSTSSNSASIGYGRSFFTSLKLRL